MQLHISGYEAKYNLRTERAVSTSIDYRWTPKDPPSRSFLGNLENHSPLNIFSTPAHRYPPHLSQNHRSGSDRGTMSSSSGTPSDSHRSPSMSRPSVNAGGNGWSNQNNTTQGWNASPAQYTTSNISPSYGSHPSPASTSDSQSQMPSRRAEPEFAWTAPPTQSNNYQHNNYNGRPLSPDGWPAKKEEIRGHEGEVRDLLSQYLEKQAAPASAAAYSSGWKKTSSSNVSGNTVTTAKATPLPPSEIGIIDSSRPARPASPTPSPPPLSKPAVAPASVVIRIPTPKAASPVPFIPIAPTPVNPAEARSPPSFSGALQPVQPPAPHPCDSPNGTNRPQSRTGTRVVSGWTVKVPFKHDDEVSPLPPVPSIPKEHAAATAVPTSRQSSTQSQYEATDTSQEAWILPNVDAIKTNNWTSTTRRSRVSREEQIPAYTHASGVEELSSASGSLGYDDDSIRPSESASNVGIANDSMPSPTGSHTRGIEVGHGQSNQNLPRYKTMRKFDSEKDSDIGSDGSSGSLNDNPNVRAGGWQRTQPTHGPRMARQTSHQTSGWTQQMISAGHPDAPHDHHQPREISSNNWSAPQAQTSRWYQQPSNGENRQTPLTAPTPRRWDSASQQLVGDLERAATPRAAHAQQMGIGHGRSVSNVSRAPASTLSIRGASKYHAETVMLREEVSRPSSVRRFVPEF